MTIHEPRSYCGAASVTLPSQVALDAPVEEVSSSLHGEVELEGQLLTPGSRGMICTLRLKDRSYLV